MPAVPAVSRRVLRRAARSPGVLRAVAAVLAVLTFLAVRHAATPSEAATRFGRPVPVVVVRRAVPAGAVLRPRDVTLRQLPARALPPDTVSATGDAVGRVALVALARGEPVVAARLAPGGLTGPAALLPAGHRAVALRTGDVAPTLRPGDAVDVLASYEPDATGAVATAVAAEAARVVEVAPGTVTVAVPADVAPDLARAGVIAELTLALRRPDE